jgi:hypothetical protein
MRKIDHIVISVPDLYEAMDRFTEKCGIEVVYGGQHLSIGTHNALLNIGNGAYLELIAKDPNNPLEEAQKWMGLDLINDTTFTRWAIKSDQLATDAAILKKASPNMGAIFEGSRKKTDGSTLSWAMTLPLAAPKVEVLPFILNWKDSVHPTEDLAAGCTIESFEIWHPEPAVIQPVFAELDIQYVVKKSKEAL